MPYTKNNGKEQNDKDASLKKKVIRRRKKVCAFCADKTNGGIDYKDGNKLKRFISERGKILPRRITGTCAEHQRDMASVVGVHGNAGQANYAASKAGLIALAKSIGQEMGPKGIRANAIAPGFIETAMTAALPDTCVLSYRAY